MHTRAVDVVGPAKLRVVWLDMYCSTRACAEL